MNHIKLFEDFNKIKLDKEFVDKANKDLENIDAKIKNHKQKKESEEKIKEDIIEESNIQNDKYQIGDLVWAKDMGTHGLVGLVVSKANKDEDDNNEYDVLYRGYNGDIISTIENDIQDIIDAEKMFYAENNGDLLHYPNIAKKINITINPKYKQYLDDVQEENL